MASLMQAWRAPARKLLLVVAGMVLWAGSNAAWAAACAGAGPFEAEPASFLRSYRPFLATPTRLAIDAEDNVYIVDALNGRIVIRAPSGRVRFDSDRFGYPISIAVDSTGRMYVGDGERGRVDVYDAQGQPLGHFGGGDGEFSLPGYLAVHEDATGVHVYVTDGEADVVRRYRGPSGELELGFGGTGSGDGEFVFPAGTTVSDGKLYVVDRGNSRIQVFTPDGAFLHSIAPQQDSCGFLCFFEGATSGRARDAGIRIGPAGHAYLTEAARGSIAVLDGAALVARVGEFGTAPGKLRVPTDVVIDSCGRLFVSSPGNERVDIFGLPGHVDPEQYAPGRLVGPTEPVDPLTASQLVVHLELPGHRLGDVQGLLANGIAVPLSTRIGDADRDAVPDLELVFGADLLATLGSTPTVTLNVTGSIGTLAVDESTTLAVVVTDLDSDDDGVDDSDDACPGTPPGVPAGPDGCSLSQRCPCEGPPGLGPWLNHGAYVECAVNVSRQQVHAGAITGVERGRTLREAARAACGKPSE